MTEEYNKDTILDTPYEKRQVEQRPDESPGLLIEAKFKIFNPETGDVIAEGRA